MVRSKSPITTDTTSPKDKNLNGRFYEDSGPTNEVADAITKSSLYINAYNLLSQDPDPMWLTRLVAIPSGLMMREAGQFEMDSGRKYKADLASVINEGFTQIKNLLAEYQEYKNSLPSTQVQQASDAGINMAITGSGIESSSINPIEASAPDVASSVPSGPEMFSNVAGGILSLTSAGTNAMSAVVQGFIDLRNLGNDTRKVDELIRQGQFNRGEAFDLELKKFGLSKDQYDLSEGVAMNAVREHLTSEGFVNVPAFKNWSDFRSWWNQFGTKESNDFNMGKRSKRKLLSSTEQVYYDALDQDLFVYSDDGSTRSASTAFRNIVDDMVNYKIESWQLDFRYQKAKKKFDYLMQLSLDPKRLAEAYNDKSLYEAELAKYRSQVEGYESQREEMKIQRLLKWIHESENSPRARALVAKALEDIDPSSLGYIDAYGAREIIDFLNQGNLNPAPAGVNLGGFGVSQKR